MNLNFRIILKSINLNSEQLKDNRFMKKFELQNLFEISGIGSASGLIYTNDKLYIIAHP